VLLLGLAIWHVWTSHDVSACCTATMMSHDCSEQYRAICGYGTFPFSGAQHTAIFSTEACSSRLIPASASICQRRFLCFFFHVSDTRASLQSAFKRTSTSSHDDRLARKSPRLFIEITNRKHTFHPISLQPADVIISESSGMTPINLHPHC